MNQKDPVLDEINRINEKIRCGYLRIGFAFAAGHIKLKPFQNEGFTFECMNPKCGPKIGCEFYQGHPCKYRSLQADDALDKQPDWDPF